MFGQYKLLAYLGGMMLVLGGIYASYTYVKNLQKEVVELNETNVQLTDANETLANSMAESERLQGIRDRLDEISSKLRQNNQVIYEQTNQEIDRQVSNNKDKPVGELLNEFLNRNTATESATNE